MTQADDEKAASEYAKDITEGLPASERAIERIVISQAFIAGAEHARAAARVLQVTFGHGRVRMSSSHIEGNKFDSVLVLSEFPEAKPVGALDLECPYRNKPADNIPGPRVELWFDNLSGLDALILSLTDIRSQMATSLPPPAPEAESK